MKKLMLIAVLALGMCSIGLSQDAQPTRQGRQGPPSMQCEGAKKIMKQMQDHRGACEVCKTNLPSRGRGMGMGMGGGRGPGGPPQK